MIHGLYAALSELSPDTSDYATLQAFRAYALEHHQHLELPLSATNGPNLNHLFNGFRNHLVLSEPGTDLNPVSPNVDVAFLSKQRILESLEWAKTLKAQYLIVPSFYQPAAVTHRQVNTWVNWMSGFWETMAAEYLANCEMTVLLRNQFDPTPDALLKIVTRVNSPFVKVALDVGYVDLFSELSAIDWFEQLAQHTLYVRLQNQDGEALAHDTPFDARNQNHIDTAALCEHLALSSHRVHLAVVGQTLGDIIGNQSFVETYLAMQAEQPHAKSFLV